MSADERQRVAYHEAGHTILGLLIAGADPVHRVTIVPRGQALGVTYQRPEDDRHNYSREYLLARITGAMGGRAAEDIVYGTVTTGAESDMEQATDLARQMVTRWGMSERLGPVTLARRDSPFLPDADGRAMSQAYSEATATLVDAEIREILHRALETSTQLIEAHRPALDALATALLEHETLEEDEILRVTGLPRAPQLQTLPRAPGGTAPIPRRISTQPGAAAAYQRSN
jgi:cell division protease FtsH